MTESERAFGEGHEAGYTLGLSVPRMVVAQQIDALIEALADLLRRRDLGPAHFALIRTISQVNAGDLLTPESAWHLREPVGECAVRRRAS